ncbi:MAG: hypothetical protein RI897_4243, partial [Verrucomicrobiota bacterium]
AYRLALVEVAVGEVDFIEAEVVAEFVEVGGADFVEERGFVIFGVVAEVLGEEDDLGWERGGGGAGFGPGFTDEEAERIGFDTVGFEVG